METPLISIVIPTYNAAKTIERTLKSVLAQTYSNFEVLIINDGSKDETLEIISRIQDPRIQVFSYVNKGLSASRNRGITRANGKYITLLDADDMWTADKLEAQLNALQKNPKAALAYSWTDYIDEQDQLLHRGCYVKANGNIYSKLLIANFLESGSNPLICKWALDEVGEFDCSLSNGADWDMWLRLAARYPFVCVAAPQVLYRVSEKSVSANVQGMEKCCLQIMERNFANAPVELQHLKHQSLGNLYLYLAFRVVEVSQSRQSSLLAIRYLGQAVKYDPSLPRRRHRLTLLALIKIFLSVLLSPQVVRQQLSAFKTRRQLA